MNTVFTVFAKLRGNFATEIEANQRAEFIIKNVDSFHQIFHPYVGRPFPLTQSDKFSNVVEEINIKEAIQKSFSKDIKNKEKKDRKDKQEILDREQKLMEETKREDEDPYEHYTILKNKKAQLTWTFFGTQKEDG